MSSGKGPIWCTLPVARASDDRHIVCNRYVCVLTCSPHRPCESRWQRASWCWRSPSRPDGPARSSCEAFLSVRLERRWRCCWKVKHCCGWIPFQDFRQLHTGFARTGLAGAASTGTEATTITDLQIGPPISPLLLCRNAHAVLRTRVQQSKPCPCSACANECAFGRPCATRRQTVQEEHSPPPCPLFARGSVIADAMPRGAQR